MIDIIVASITTIALGCLLYWAFRPALRQWFEYPKYKMLEDEKKFSDLSTNQGPRITDNPGH
jgi:cbb3-type cytochrome oxidase subunit 3